MSEQAREDGVATDGDRGGRGSVAPGDVTPMEALRLHGMQPASQKRLSALRAQGSVAAALAVPPAPVSRRPWVHLPLREKLDWAANIRGARYLATLLLWWPVAMARTAEEPSLPEISDEELDRLLTTGVYSRFLTPFSLTKPPPAVPAPPGDSPDPGLIFRDAWPRPRARASSTWSTSTPIRNVRPYHGMCTWRPR